MVAAAVAKNDATMRRSMLTYGYPHDSTNLLVVASSLALLLPP
jgi:hypothetical protein